MDPATEAALYAAIEQEMQENEHALDGWIHNGHIDRTQISFGDALLNACAYEDVWLVRRLVEEDGHPVNGYGEDFSSPLELAVLRNDLEMVEYLLSQGAIVERIYDVDHGIYPSAEQRNTRTTIVGLLRDRLPAGAE
jgi:ankyrin repeat protein